MKVIVSKRRKGRKRKRGKERGREGKRERERERERGREGEKECYGKLQRRLDHGKEKRPHFLNIEERKKEKVEREKEKK